MRRPNPKVGVCLPLLSEDLRDGMKEGRCRSPPEGVLGCC